MIIQTASIGDVILATPVVEKLYDHFQDSKIDFLLKEGNESLFKGHPKIRRVIVWEKKEKKYKNLLDILRIIQDEKYDHVINIQRFGSSGFLTAFSRAKNTIGFDKNPFSIFFGKRIKHSIRKEGIHEIERNHKLIEHLTDEKPAKVKLYPSQNDFAKTSQYKTTPYICIAPASLWFTKQYPKEKWVEFLNEVPENYYVYFLGAKNDLKLCEDIIKHSGHQNCLNFAGKFSLLETAALMQHAVMNFVNDSAPLHLASSVNGKVTALFCSTIPLFGFGPLSDDAVVVETKEKLDCRPCGLHGLKTCPKEHFKCALTIDKNDLLSRI